MGYALVNAGALTIQCRYVFLRRGVLYYRRRIPDDLRAHFGGREHRMVSLGTREPLKALSKAQLLASADDQQWSELRGRPVCAATVPPHVTAGLLKLLAVHTVPQTEPVAPQKAPAEPHRIGPKLSDAFSAYLREHPKGAHPKFKADTQRILAKVVAEIGDQPLTEYRRDHARTLRDALLAQGLATSSVRRQLTILVAAWRSACRELDLQTLGSPFGSVIITGENEDAHARQPFTAEELRTIAGACRAKDDDIRWIVALQMDTGARLGEIVGLRVEDVCLDAPVPYIHIRPHQKLGRTLKTANSERKVPVLGMALWGAQQASLSLPEASRNNGWLFLRYASVTGPKATHAANTINKWLGMVTATDKTSHSFRHSMRDRLRAAGVHKEVAEAIGGWGSRSIADGYGEGFQLDMLARKMEKIIVG